MPDHAKMLADLRAAVSKTESAEELWAKHAASAIFLIDHGPALLAMLEAEGAAVLAEREACAALCEAQAYAHKCADDGMAGVLAGAPFRNLAAAIRARTK